MGNNMYPYENDLGSFVQVNRNHLIYAIYLQKYLKNCLKCKKHLYEMYWNAVFNYTAKKKKLKYSRVILQLIKLIAEKDGQFTQ